MHEHRWASLLGAFILLVAPVGGTTILYVTVTFTLICRLTNRRSQPPLAKPIPLVVASDHAASRRWLSFGR